MSDFPTGQVPTALCASFFPDIYTSAPQRWRGSFSTLAARLARFPVRADIADKRRLPCWSPAAFRGAGSKNEDAAFIGALVFDVDSGATIDEAERRCAPWAMVLHSTWSHTAGAPRFRIVLPLSRAVPADRWQAAWQLATAQINLSVDRSCCNPNRRYFLPAAPCEGAPTLARSALDRPALDLLGALPSQPNTLRACVARAASIQVPWRLRHHAAALRLASDPASRRRTAEALGASIVGAGDQERADHLACPGCGRPSVWFFLAPARASRARCKHRRSCAWTGSLVDLLGASS